MVQETQVEFDVMAYDWLVALDYFLDDLTEADLVSPESINLQFLFELFVCLSLF